jgi:flagellar hook-length control protein FliK
MPPMIIAPSVGPNASGQPRLAASGSRTRNADEAQGRSFGAALDALAQRQRHEDARRKRRRRRHRPQAAAQAGAGRRHEGRAARRPEPRLPGNRQHAAACADPRGPRGGTRRPRHRCVRRAGCRRCSDRHSRGRHRSGRDGEDPTRRGAGRRRHAGHARSGLRGQGRCRQDRRACRPEMPLDSDATPAPLASLQEVVRAAVAAQAMAVDGAKPASTPAGSPIGTAASGRAGAPRAAVSATTAEQLAAAAQPKAAEAATPSAAATAPALAAAADDATDPSLAVNPVALQQPAPSALASTATPADRFERRRAGAGAHRRARSRQRRSGRRALGPAARCA